MRGALGVAVVLALGAGFEQLLVGVLDGGGLTGADRPVLWFLAAHRRPWSISTAQVITDLGSPLGAGVTGLVVGVVLALLWRSWLPLLVVALGWGGIVMINTVVKDLVGRDRPPSATAVLGEHGFSFPSGHTTATTVVWLLSAWLLDRWVVDRRLLGRVAVWSGAVLMIISVGVTRVYLGVHFLSDVLAGWVLGLAWALTIVLVTTRWAGEAAQGAGRRSTGAG